MVTLTLPVTRTIRQDVATVLTYAFSRGPLEQLVEKRFEGEFQQFRETAFQIAAQHAERACLELALLIRYLDEVQNISETYVGYSQVDFGSVTKADGTVAPLTLRDVANKIIHARGLAWDTKKEGQPKLVCHSRDDQRWTEANVDITALAAVCGSLAG
jgi:hypothetical protein